MFLQATPDLIMRLSDIQYIRYSPKDHKMEIGYSDSTGGGGHSGTWTTSNVSKRRYNQVVGRA